MNYDHADGTRYRQDPEPRDAYCEFWLAAAFDVLEKRQQSARTVAKWLAGSVNSDAHITISTARMRGYVGMGFNSTRNGVRELRKAGFIRATDNSIPGKPHVARTLHLVLPASVVDAELQAMADRTQEVSA